MHDNWNLNCWWEYTANTIYSPREKKINDVIAKQQISESERIKITHLIREASIQCSLQYLHNNWTMHVLLY